MVTLPELLIIFAVAVFAGSMFFVPARIFLLQFIFVGACLTSYGLYCMYQVATQPKESTIGTIVDVSPISDGLGKWQTTFDFTVNETTYTGTQISRNEFRFFHEGQHVSVRFDKNNPADAELASTALGRAIMSSLVGAIFIVLPMYIRKRV